MLLDACLLSVVLKVDCQEREEFRNKDTPWCCELEDLSVELKSIQTLKHRFAELSMCLNASLYVPACHFSQSLVLFAMCGGVDGLRFSALLSLSLAVVNGQRVLEKRLRAARERGLDGYDLIDAMDVWYGSNSPDFRGPHNQLDFIGNRDGKVTLEDWQAAGLPTEHFQYFDSNHDGRLSVDEAHSWHQQRKPARGMNLSEIQYPPQGHLQPMGSWKPPLPSNGLEYRKPYPHPRDFWRKHMDGYLPANLKGAQHGWPSMNWTREELIKRFGWVDAKLEPKVGMFLLFFLHHPRHYTFLREICC